MKVWSSLNAVLCWYFVTLILQLNYITLQKVTTGQRMTESSVLDAHCTEVSSDHSYHTWRPVFLIFRVDMRQYISKLFVGWWRTVLVLWVSSSEIANKVSKFSGTYTFGSKHICMKSVRQNALMLRLILYHAYTLFISHIVQICTHIHVRKLNALNDTLCLFRHQNQICFDIM